MPSRPPRHPHSHPRGTGQKIPPNLKLANLPSILSIIGSTASGKSALALSIALEVQGEILNADSRQIYQFMDAGTSKPSREDREKVPHHLYDFLDPRETYSAGAYVRDAGSEIKKILSRGKIPIVVGGTGLYLKALFEGLADLPPRNDGIRAKLLALAEKEGRLALHKKLAQADPRSAQKIPPQNIQRVLRALEVLEMTGKSLSQIHQETPKNKPAFAARFFGLSWERNALRSKILERCAMIADPILEETKGLLEKGYSRTDPGLQSLGYRSAVDFLENRIDKSEFNERLALDTLHYAKRQMTWFRRDPRITWLEVSHPLDLQALTERILKIIRNDIMKVIAK